MQGNAIAIRMKTKHKMTSSADAVKDKGQHKKPCHDCPWRRSAIPGWLGGSSVRQWLMEAHGEVEIPCHCFKGAQCAGSAIYRSNVLKRCRNPNALVLPPDKKSVFCTPMEFEEYHGPHVPKPIL